MIDRQMKVALPKNKHITYMYSLCLHYFDDGFCPKTYFFRHFSFSIDREILMPMPVMDRGNSNIMYVS